MSTDNYQCCLDCYFLETFAPHPEEPSDMGCREKEFAGYITDPTNPPCCGQRFQTMNVYQCKCGHNYNRHYSPFTDRDAPEPCKDCDCAGYERTARVRTNK